MANPFLEKFERSVRMPETYAGVQLCIRTMGFMIEIIHHLHHILDPIPYFVTLNHAKVTTLDLNIAKSTNHIYFIL